MTVAKFVQPDYTSQSGTVYPLSIDAAFAVLARLAAAFAPHAQDTPTMTVRVDAGAILNGTTLTEVAEQSTGTITAPTTNPRIDRVVIDTVTGAVSVIAGTEAASPVAPAIPSGKIPVGRVLLQTSSIMITNSMITDERVSSTNSVRTEFISAFSGVSVNATSITTLATVDLGAVIAGDRIMVQGVAMGNQSNGAQADRTLFLAKSSGTATLVPADPGFGGIARSVRLPIGSPDNETMNGIFRVSGSGTLILKLAVFQNWANPQFYTGDLYALLLRGGF